MNKYITVDNIKYLIMKDEKEGFDLEALTNLYTDYFKNYDYIVGDWAYGKLRLKGFNSKTNKNFKSINDIDKVDEYIKKNCAYGCRYFIISKE